MCGMRDFINFSNSSLLDQFEYSASARCKASDFFKGLSLCVNILPAIAFGSGLYLPLSILPCNSLILASLGTLPENWPPLCIFLSRLSLPNAAPPVKFAGEVRLEPASSAFVILPTGIIFGLGLGTFGACVAPILIELLLLVALPNPAEAPPVDSDLLKLAVCAADDILRAATLRALRVTVFAADVCKECLFA